MPRFFYVIFIVCFARILTAHELTVDSCELIFEEKSYPGEAIENVESISMQPPNFTAYSSTGFRVIYHRNNYRTYLISQDSGVQFSEFKQVYRALNRIGLAKHIAGYVEKDNLLDFTKDPVFHFVAKEVSFAVLYHYYKGGIFSEEADAKKLAKGLSIHTKLIAKKKLIEIVHKLNRHNLYTNFFEYQVTPEGQVLIHEVELFKLNPNFKISLEETMKHFKDVFGI
ncbi:MAG: hypothetical protein H6622_06595 [Halobacteriovoraceae bacterium]|nr:hypothetical protein [Halobacteriovoraceae bacterium]